MSQPKSAKSANPEWTVRAERGSPVIMRLMVWTSLQLGRPFGRLILRGIALYFLLLAPAARRASAGYLRRALGRAPRLADFYRHFFYFSTALHDRIYLLNDRFDLFELELVGEEKLIEATTRAGGAVLIGGHMGSFEVLRALARKHQRLDIAVAMYQDNARKFSDILAAINPRAAQTIIPLAQFDSMLKIRDRLEQGGSIGMLGDRAPNSDGMVQKRFLGDLASFPIGAFRLAAVLKKPVLFMTGLYLGGNRYRMHFETLADFSALERTDRNAAIDQALERYVGCLDRYCRLAPYNWFNFYDFWAAPAPKATPHD